MLQIDLIDSFGSHYQVLVALTFVVLLVCLYQISTRTDVPKIANIPEIPGALPITGHLLSLGDDHATVCEKWWRYYKQSIFQIRLGNTRAVVVNSFDDCKKMLVDHQSAVIDRPTVFHAARGKGGMLTSNSYTRSTASYPRLKALPSDHRHGTKAARTSAKQLVRL